MNATTTVLQTDSLLFRPALPDDLERICTIIHQAQAQMRLRGSRQWQNGYPAAAHITDDIDRGYGHVLCTHTGLVVAYGAVVFDGEPAYAEIDGTWLDQAPYVVLHRLAVAQEVKGQGIATEFMRRTMTLARERGTGSFRIDTNFDNRCMLRLLAKFGFVRCGEIHYAGDPPIAFQKSSDRHILPRKTSNRSFSPTNIRLLPDTRKCRRTVHPTVFIRTFASALGTSPGKMPINLPCTRLFPHLCKRILLR